MCGWVIMVQWQTTRQDVKSIGTRVSDGHIVRLVADAEQLCMDDLRGCPMCGYLLLCSWDSHWTNVNFFGSASPEVATSTFSHLVSLSSSLTFVDVACL